MDAIKQYFRLCWFDVNPLTLEKSTGFFKLNLLFYGVVQYLLQANMTDDPFESFFEVIFELLLTLSFIGIMLFFDKLLRVYVQITTAILFCTNVVSVSVIPVMVWLTTTDEPLSYYLMTILILWFYALTTYIIKMSLALDMFASIALAMLYFMIVYLGAFGLGQLLI